MPLPHKPRAILVDVIPPFLEHELAARRLLELEALTKTYGGLIIVEVIQKRSQPDYRTYVGSGKVQDIAQLARANQVDLIIINNQLKSKQLFEIEEIIRKTKPATDKTKSKPVAVWDRVDLILKIFSKHAKTTEAKLQIKLAAIRHMGPRIFGMGMELMQQAGGIGTRGAGETNIEIMRRHLAEQEKTVMRQLEKASMTRSVHRARRTRLGFKTVSIVGYTNAGKSSLLNALTHKGAYVADELFATLDTRVAKLWLPTLQTNVLLSDTIGFIQDLPPQLISAFRSTLDETIEADLLLHVIDASDPHQADKILEVEAILKQLGVSDTPTIYVFNKLDQAKRLKKTDLKKQYKEKTPVFVSALSGVGLEDLKKRIGQRLCLTLPPTNS